VTSGTGAGTASSRPESRNGEGLAILAMMPVTQRTPNPSPGPPNETQIIRKHLTMICLVVLAFFAGLAINHHAVVAA